MSEVAEESQGWYRLRTVTEDWNSDEEESKTKKPSDDLRTVLKVQMHLSRVKVYEDLANQTSKN